MNKEQLIKQIEQEINLAQQNIQTWEKNLERYKDYVKELNDQLIIIKVEIKNTMKEKNNSLLDSKQNIIK
ncbi:MAG: hypothetical protein GBAus27B_000239 [Mycoplasmataceae bacterium]|nr:MAG: hypothetical protein GBAus27B_000239 [Mycoplasmataceae bacterium]